VFLKRVFGIFLILGVVTACVSARPDRNAFVNQKVATTAELVNQARRDPAVMDRYMRHFGMTRTEVLAYLGTLKPDTIKEEGVYAVYSVPEGGKIKLHLERLKKGHKIFAQSDGTPQLIMKCGNPLTLGPKDVIALNKTPVTSTETFSEETPITIVTETESEVEPLLAMQPVEPAYTLTTPPDISPQIISAGGFNPLPLALGGLAFLDGGGGGGEPVPEPMTMAVFGAGLAYLGVRRRMRAQK